MRLLVAAMFLAFFAQPVLADRYEYEVAGVCQDEGRVHGTIEYEDYGYYDGDVEGRLKTSRYGYGKRFSGEWVGKGEIEGKLGYYYSGFNPTCKLIVTGGPGKTW